MSIVQEVEAAYRPQLPSPNAFDYYYEAGRTLESLSAFSSDRQPPSREERQWVERHQRAYTLLRDGTRRAYSLPEFWVNSELFPYLAWWRNLARLVNARIRYAIALQDGQDAVRDWQAGFKFARDIQGDNLLSLLVGFACEQLVHAPIVHQMDFFSAHECRQIAQTLAESERQPDRLPSAIEGETKIMLKWLDKTFVPDPDRGIMNLLEIAGFSGVGEERSDTELQQRIEALNRLRQNPDEYARFTEQVRQHALREIQRFSEAFALKRGRFQRVPDTEPRTLVEMVASVFAPSTAIPGQRYWETRARRRLMLIHLLLRVHYLAEGRYPPTLDALNLKELAIDPFSGEPFIYRLQGERYVLYSVGAVGHDLGGKRRQPDDPPNTPENLFLTRNSWR
ncbi:MAG: hypothetical protein N2045_09770 [Fimbriimonadales bacterium]|nr:hypothetical protein [Fimbriimonadales bacterium]GIV13919.1 MAG: hypothetical protein KatS3mg021_2201 [Fimbriimonadales bacterium]CUU11222.1 hypothetical protein GBSOP10_11076 [Armatimonadetes bacterium GBS]CUU34904.1 hypothetical protein GXSOP10_11952 [Armatimonadetes bacterium GXS]